MRRYFAHWVGCVLFALLGSVFLWGGEVTITIDDVPIEDGRIFSGEERTGKIISELRKQEVPHIAIFAVGGQAESSDGAYRRVQRYGEAGHFVGNHTYTHPHLKKVGAKRFLTDVDQAEVVLRDIPNFRKWFRYPYLDEGSWPGDKNVVRKALRERGYRNGYVTLGAHDSRMDAIVQEAIEGGKKVDFEKLRDVYLSVTWECVQFYEKLSREKFGKEIKHVFLLHENDLTALYIGDVIAMLRENGWKIISPEEAFEGPIALFVPETIISLLKRVAKKVAIKVGLKGPRNPEVASRKNLDRLFKREGVVN